MSAAEELTAVLIRFRKSFGIKVLSKYKMIKIQLGMKMALVSLVFPLQAGKAVTLVNHGLRVRKKVILLMFLQWPSTTAGQSLK